MTQQLSALTNKVSDLEQHIQLLSSLTTALSASLQQNAHDLYQNIQQPDVFATPSECGTGRKRIMDSNTTSYKTQIDAVK